MSSSNFNGEPVRISDTYIYNSVLRPTTSFEGFQLTDCELKNSTIQYGLGTRDSQLQIIHSNILNVNVNFSVRVDNRDSYRTAFIAIRKSVVRDFTVGPFDSWGAQGRHNLTFEHSTLSNITVIDIPTYMYSYSSVDYAVDLCIRNCTFTTGNATLSHPYSSINVDGSELQNVSIVNTRPDFNNRRQFSLDMRDTRFHNGAIKLPMSSVRIAYSNVTLASTPLLIGDNSSLSCSSIRPSPSNQEVKQIGVSATGLRMTQSSISNFYIGLRVTPRNANSVNISKSSFESNELYNIDNMGAHNVNAQENWWGTANRDAIRSKINDYWHDLDLGQVFYTNYSLMALKAEANCAPDDPSVYSTSIFPTNKATAHSGWFGVLSSLIWISLLAFI